MKKNNLKRIESYVTYWRPKLFLQGWEIYLEEQKKDEYKLNAEITVSYEYRNATIRLFPSFFKNTAKEQKEIILHELIHIISEPYKAMFNQIWKDKLVTIEDERKANEYMTSWLTQIIVTLNSSLEKKQ